MSRELLPTRRPCETFDIEVRGVHYTVSTGFYPDGRLGEIFLTGPKAGTDVEVNAKDAAVTVSIALQYGASPDELRHGLQHDPETGAQSPVGVVLDLLASGEGG